MARCKVLFSLICAASTIAALAAEGDPVGSEFQVSTTSTVNNPDVAIDGTGNFVAVWQGGGGNLFMQRYDNAGARRGVESPVNTGTTNAFTPRIAVNDAGSYVVAWGGSAASDTDGVYMRRFDANGVAQGAAPTLVNTTTAGFQGNPDVAMNGSGAFVVTWVDVDGASQSTVRAQRYSAAGTPQGAELTVSTNTGGARSQANVGMDDAGNFIVVWESPGDGDQTGIYGRRYDASGAPLSGELVLNAGTTGAQTYPAVAMAPNGTFVAAWFSWNGNNIIAQRYAADGTRIGAELVVSAGNVSFSGPDVGIDDSGKFLVTWERIGAETGGTAFSYGIFARRYAADGTAPAAIQVNNTVAENQDFAAVAMDPDGDTVVVWQTAHLRSNMDIFARRYAGAAAPPPPSDTVPDAFSFTDQANVAAGVTVTSNAVTISGINAAAPISVTGGSYSIGCSATFTTSAGTINNGETVCVRHTSSGAASTATNTTLSIGGVVDTFTSTTQAAPPDTTPDAFTFTQQTDVEPGSVRTSNTITVSGITAAATISISGGEYSIGCGAGFTSASGNVSNGQTVCVRHTAAAAPTTTVTTTLTIGGVSGAFTSITRANPRSGGGGGIDTAMLLCLLLLWAARRRGGTLRR